MPRYRVKAPDGRELVIEGPHPPDQMTVSRAFLAQANATPLNEPSTEEAGRRQGAIEGATRGGLGYLEGLARSPVDLAKGLYGLATTNPVTSATNMAEGVMNLVPRAYNVGRSIVTGEPNADAGAIAADPRGYARELGSAVGQAAILERPSMVPRTVGAVGRGLEAVGSSPTVRRLTTYGGVGGAFTGNVPAMLGSAVPAVLRGTGRVLQRGAQAAEDAGNAVSASVGRAATRVGDAVDAGHEALMRAIDEANAPAQSYPKSGAATPRPPGAGNWEAGGPVKHGGAVKQGVVVEPPGAPGAAASPAGPGFTEGEFTSAWQGQESPLGRPGQRQLPAPQMREELPPELRTQEEATGTRETFPPPPAALGPTMASAADDATHQALLRKMGGQGPGPEAPPAPSPVSSSAQTPPRSPAPAQVSADLTEPTVVPDSDPRVAGPVPASAMPSAPIGNTEALADALNEQGGAGGAGGAAGPVEETQPSPPPGAAPDSKTTRLYRGESSAAIAGPDAGLNFTDDPLAAQGYAKRGGDAGTTYYIDLPEEQAASFRTTDPTGQGVHILPADLAEQARGNVLGAGIEPGTSVIKPKPKGRGRSRITKPILQDEAPAAAAAPEAAPAPAAEPEAPAVESAEPTPDVETMPIGPGNVRVKEWKPGMGPTAEDAAKARSELGSRDAAQRLKTTQAQVKALTPDMATQLPAKARAAIDARLQSLQGEELKAFIDAAPNPLVKVYIQQRLSGGAIGGDF